jgi:hypothetical protein
VVVVITQYIGMKGLRLSSIMQYMMKELIIILWELGVLEPI